MRKWKKGLAVWVAACIFVSGLTTAPEPLQANVVNQSFTYLKANPQALGIQVDYHTQKEISAYVQEHPAEKTDPLTFARNPVVTGNYDMGELSAKTQKSALNMLKQIRYIAGISDQVTLNDRYTKMTQAAALTNYVNDKLSHYPTQPKDMDDELYQLGADGACSSNLAWASWSGRSLNETIVDAWMDDGDSFNIDRIGHRRWLLNPEMSETGFGAVSGSNGTYSAVYAFDSGNDSASERGVCWPAQNMPVEYFGTSFPWSVSTGTNEKKSTVKVTLTNQRTGQVWNFSKEASDGVFYVNNDGYGQTGCIIFRPKDVKEYADGDKYKVEITGLANEDISYTVNFFRLYPKKDTSVSMVRTKITGISTREYTGKQICPSVKVTYGSKTLVKNRDYTVKYGANKLGKASVTITGKGNYVGSVVKYFNIVPRKTTVSAKPSSKGKIRVTLSKRGEAARYQIQYAANSKFKGAKTTTQKSTKYVIAGKAKKTYYVRVRTMKTIGKTNYYSGWSKTVKVTAK